MRFTSRSLVPAGVFCSAVLLAIVLAPALAAPPKTASKTAAKPAAKTPSTEVAAKVGDHKPAKAGTAASDDADEDDEKPFGLKERELWTTSKVSGSPDPPYPYRTERIFPHLKFDRPLDMENCPGSNRMFVCEHSGMIYSFDNDNEAQRAELFLDMRPKDDRYRQWDQHRQIWSMAFHPKFTENGYVFVCYADPLPRPQRIRISRFQVDLKKPQVPPTCDPDTEYLMLEWPSPVDHHGGCLKFGPEGYLYFSCGDGSGIADGNDSGQDLSDFHAAVMRIDVDHNDKGKCYAVPKDNPFVNLPNTKGEIWSYGTRNIWKMSFDRKTGDLWAGDVGQDLWDMIYCIKKGDNYGWSVKEGTHDFLPERKVGPTPILPPVVEHSHSEARSITGGFVYRGERLKELIGAYIYGDYDTGKIWGVRYDGKKVTWHKELIDTALRIVGFAEDHDGELYIVDYTGTIHRLVPAPAADLVKKATDFPRLLSETGLFSNVKTHQPAAGLIPYDVVSPLWSDGALKERFIAAPGDAKIEYSTNEGWKFPEGSVLVKTFAMELEPGNPESRKRLETRLLHIEQDHWRGYVYVWNDAQTDATLLDAAGDDRKLLIADKAADGGQREQVWHFPSRAECTICHTMPARFVLGLNTLQMNKDHDYHGVIDNQLRSLEHIGMFTKPIADYYKPIPPQVKPSEIAEMVNPRDETATLDSRARAYLHANCAHCHMRSGGGNAGFQLLYNLPLDGTGTLMTPAAHGDFGIKGAALLVPGDPEKSLILRRMAKLGQGRMPHVASNVVDAEAVKLINEWILDMPAK